ncbi:Uncharacterised protein [uncultured archaeon]|nr:Uncharacterised protein [uncultured archaeon]
MAMLRGRPHFGQVTLEWLMLGVLALTLLLIASAAISRAQSAQTNLAEKRILQLQVQEIGYYADQICVLGEGNTQTVALSPIYFTLAYSDSVLNMSKGKMSALRKTLCPINVVDADGYKAMAYLTFERDTTGGRPQVRIANKPQEEPAAAQ